jgi:hypothetical protein
VRKAALLAMLVSATLVTGAVLVFDTVCAGAAVATLWIQPHNSAAVAVFCAASVLALWQAVSALASWRCAELRRVTASIAWTSGQLLQPALILLTMKTGWLS